MKISCVCLSSRNSLNSLGFMPGYWSERQVPGEDGSRVDYPKIHLRKGNFSLYWSSFIKGELTTKS